MASRSLFALVSLFFTAGALLLMFFIILAGTTQHNPLTKFYFLQADTSKIPGAPALSRWTFWNICNVSPDGLNTCPRVHPAFPLDPPSGRNFGTTTGVPDQFIGKRQYFYLTRFMFAFELIALFFTTCSLLLGGLALCTRIGSYLSGFLAFLGLFFQTIVCPLMTAAYVKGRNNFRSKGQSASLGKYAFGFEWAAWACLLISTIFFCLGGRGSKDSVPSYSTSRRGFFRGRRSKSTRSRGSFIDGDRKEFA